MRGDLKCLEKPLLASAKFPVQSSRTSFSVQFPNIFQRAITGQLSLYSSRTSFSVQFPDVFQRAVPGQVFFFDSFLLENPV